MADRNAWNHPLQRWTSARRFAAPSLGKSLSASVLLHVLVVGALYGWPKESTERFTMAGRRQVLHFEATTVEVMPSSTVIEREPPALEIAEPSADAERRMSPEPIDRRLSEVRRTTGAKMELAADAGPPRERLVALESSALKKDVAATELPQVQVAMPRDGRRDPRPIAAPPPSQPPSMPSPQAVGLDKQVPPDLSSNPFPKYPAEAVRRRLEGTVLLRLRIDVQGEVQQVDVADSSGHAVLDRAAAEAVRSWRGTPAHRGGQPVPSVELLPVRFRL